MNRGRSLWVICRRLALGEGEGGCPPPPSPRAGLRIFCGATIGMAVITYLAMTAAVPILVASFGASACLIFAVPHGPFSRPRNVILGHAVAALVGVAAVHTLGCTWYAAALAVGGAIAAMLYSATLHPPAAATALIAVLTKQDFLYPLVPVAAGAAILSLAGMIFNRLAETAAAKHRRTDPQGG